MVSAICLLFIFHQSSLAQETKDLFDWFETFGVSRYLNKPLVSLGSGAFFDFQLMNGFLIEESNDQVTILTPDLAVAKIPKSSIRGDDALVPYKLGFKQVLLNTVDHRLNHARQSHPKENQ